MAAPKSADWHPGERWRDESHDGLRGVRLTASVGYGRARVTGDLPDVDTVMLRVTYWAHPGIRPFDVAVGGWGAPTKRIVPEGDGWRTGEAAFSMDVVRKCHSSGAVGLMIRCDRADVLIVGKIELYVPSRDHLLDRFRSYVASATRGAWRKSEAGDFEHVRDYDDKTPLSPSPEDVARGAIPFVRSYLIPIYPASVPRKAERVLKVKARMTPGEYEPVQIGIKALRDFPEACARIVGRLPRGLRAEVRWQECVPLRTAGGSSSRKWHVQPNRLWPRDVFPTCKVKKGDAQAWWVTFGSNDGLAPRVYPVEVAVTNAGAEVLRFGIDVRILPFALPKKVDYAWGFYTQGTVPPAAVDDLAAHGCNSLSAWPRFAPARGKKVDFDEWDAHFAMLKDKGVDHSFAWYLGNKNSGWQVHDSMGRAAFVEALKGINERVRDGRYPGNFCVTIDEAVRSDRAWRQLRSLFALMKKHAPGLKRFGVSLNRHRDAVKHEGMIDILSCNGSFAENSDWCRRNGYGMYTYTVFSGRTTSGLARYNAGFNPWRYSATGTYGWAMMWYNGHPYDDLDDRVSDWGIILPNWAGRPIATPAWEGFREGVDDRRYVEVYADLVRHGKADGALLESIKRLLKEDQLSDEQKVGDSIFEARLNNALKLSRARAAVIDGILGVMGKR